MRLSNIASLGLVGLVGCVGVIGAPEEEAPPPQGFERRVTVDTPEGPETWRYQGLAGLAVAEGDIVLGPLAEVDAAARARGLITPELGKRWPGGVVPFEIADDFEDPQLVEDALDEIEAQTHLRFVPRTSQAQYVRYENQWPFLSSMADLGMQSGATVVHIQFHPPGEHEVDEASLRAHLERGARHETGHALGLKHEHSRSDRDDFIRRDSACGGLIDWWYEVTGNWEIASDFKRVGRYDLASIMHYPSKRGEKTVWSPGPLGVPLPRTVACFDFVVRESGQPLDPAFTLSAGDVRTLDRSYFPDTAYAASFPAADQVLWVNKKSGLCLGLGGEQMADGVTVTQATCRADRLDQRWYLVYHPGAGYTVVNALSGKCLDVPGASTANGARVQQFECHGGPNQQLDLAIGNYVAGATNRFLHSGRCLEIRGGSGASGERAQQNACLGTGGDHQRWLVKTPAALGF